MNFLFIILLGTLNWHSNGFAQSARSQRSVQATQAMLMKNSKWQRSSSSVIQKQGLHTGDATHCEKFDVKLVQDLHVKIVCGEFEKNIQVNLNKTDNRLVSRKKDHITITQFNYHLKKVQVDQMTQKSLRIPYVEEIIHLNIQSNGDLAFHQQSFILDQFGRIVQNQLIEAHGLKPSEVSLTARASNKKRHR